MMHVYAAAAATSSADGHSVNESVKRVRSQYAKERRELSNNACILHAYGRCVRLHPGTVGTRRLPVMYAPSRRLVRKGVT